MSTNNPESVADGQLKALVSRIENLEEEKRTIADDIKEVYAEAKGSGFDTKILRKIISRRRKTRDEIDNEEAMVDLYESSLNATRT